MWPRCRGRRLPVKLTGAPAAPAAGGPDSGGGGGPPLSLVVDCSLQAAPDSTETRVQAVAALPDAADGQPAATCGCSRKPCCCVSSSQQRQDHLRPANYEPREALFRMRGGRKVRLTPVPASGSRGEPQRLLEQTRLLPRSQHRRLILHDTAAGGQGKTAAATTSTKPARQQVQNPAQQVTCPQHQTPATGETSRRGTHTAVEEAVHGDRQPERLGGQQLLLFLLLPNAFPLRQASLSGLPANTKPPVQTTHPTTKDVWSEDPYRGPFKGQKEHISERPETQIRRTNASTQEAQHVDYRADALDSQKEPSLSRLAPFNGDLQAELQQQTTHPTTKDVWNEDPYRGPFKGQKEHMSERPETQITGTNASTQEAQHGDYRADTLDSKKEGSLSRLATFNGDLQAKMQQQPCGNCSPVRFSCQHGPLPSQPETSKHNINIAIVEVPRSDCSLETLNGHQEPLSSVPGTFRRGMHVTPPSDDSLDRLRSQWEPLPSKLGTSKYDVQIPTQESLHSGRKPQRLSSQQELLSSIPGTPKYGIHIPIQKSLHSSNSPKRHSSQHLPLSSTLGTFKYGIHIPNHESSCSNRSTERLSGRQELLFSRPGTSKYGIHIPLQRAPHVGHSPERLRGHQKLVVSRSGTSKHGIYIPVQEAHHSGFNYEKLSSQHKPLSSRSGTSKHGIHIPVQVASRIAHSPERLSSQPETLSSRLETSNYGMRIPVQVARHIAHSPERLSSQPEPLSSRLGTSKYGIRIPVQVAPHIVHSPEKLTSQPESLSSRLGTSKYGTHIPFQETPYSYFSPERLNSQQKVMSSRSVTSRHGIHGIVVPNSGHHLGKFTSQHMTMSSEVPTQEPCQDNGPVHTTDKQTQMPEEPEKHAQGTPHVTEEKPPQNHRSWILGFLLDRLFGTPNPSTQGIRPTTMHDGGLSEVQCGQLWEMLVTSALMTHSVQLEQMAEKVEGFINPNHYEIQEEPLPDGGPNHISDDHMQESSRSEANVQVIPSTIEEAPLQDRHAAIFSFLQDQLIARLKESIKRTQPKRRDGLQEEHHPEECRSGQVPAIPETTTEYISHTIEEKFNAQQEQISEKIKTPAQHVHTGVEIVLHENRSPDELKFQQEQLSERAHTSMQGIQPITVHTLHEEEPLEHEQLSTISETLIQGLQPKAEEQLSTISETLIQGLQPKAEEQLSTISETLIQVLQSKAEEQLSTISETLIQGLQPKAEDAAYEEEQLSESPQTPIQSMQPTTEDVISKEELLEQKKLSASLQTSVQDMQPTGEEASYQEEQLELEQFSATPQTSIQDMRATMEEVLSEEEQVKQKQLPTSLQTSMQDIQHITEEAPHEKEQLEQEQLSAISQTYMQGMQPTAEEVPHEEEPQEQEQLSVVSQIFMEGMERVIEDATLDEEQLEQEQLLAWPQTSMQDIQPTTEDTSYEEEQLELEQLSVTLQTSIQSLQSVTEEVPYEEKPLKQEQLSVSPETSMQSLQTTREYAPYRKELEEVQLSATPRAFKQVLQPIMLEARYEGDRNETPVSQKVQASTVATTSEQETRVITEEASDVDNSASVRQRRTAARLVRSVIDARPKKLKSPHLAAFRSLHERVSEDQKPVEKRIFPSEKVVPAARGESLHYRQDQIAAKQNLHGKNRNNVAEEIHNSGSSLDT